MQIKSADNRILQEQLQNKVHHLVIEYFFLIPVFLLPLWSFNMFIPHPVRYSEFQLYEFGYLQSAENKELQDKLRLLEQQLTSFTGDRSSLIFEQHAPGESVDELKKKIQSQVILTCLNLCIPLRHKVTTVL